LEALENLLKRAKKINISKIVNAILRDKKVQVYILNLNRYEQLYDFGIDANGKSLGEYSAKTIIIKEAKNQPFDHVTLKDTGDFYKSFKLIIGANEFEIDANTEKDDKDLAEVYGEILGLTDENVQIVIELFKERLGLIILDAITGV